MALKLSRELMENSLSKYLQEGETIDVLVYAQKMNYFMTLLHKYYFLAITNKRLLIMRVTAFYNEKEFKAVNLEDIKGFKTSKSINGKTVTIEGKNGRIFKGTVPSVILGFSEQKESAFTFMNKLQGLNIYAV
ncbi:PH domain-containing protein [Alloiococcus sp. CFN-8]|uniref:PH domain-containing protein n=1 Tax=Alloiococcus sp. CFN-8 TaxID=3416081 RepID=UPI003CE99280